MYIYIYIYIYIYTHIGYRYLSVVYDFLLFLCFMYFPCSILSILKRFRAVSKTWDVSLGTGGSIVSSLRSYNI